ncbi:MAG: D-alanyl-D-alanine carboxypeptidase family protein [Bacilli bacterium]
MAKKKKINKKKLLIIIGICILLVIVGIMIYLFTDKRSIKDIFKYKDKITIEVGDSLPVVNDYLYKDINSDIEIEWKDIDTEDNKIYKAGIYYGSFIYDNDKKNITLVVEDNTPPVIDGVKDYEMLAYETVPDFLDGVTVSDNSMEDIVVTIDGKYDSEKSGTYVMYYKASDSSNNTTSKEFKLVVKENSNVKISKTKNGNTIKNYYGVTYIDNVIIANKTYSLPSNFVPNNLVTINGYIKVVDYVKDAYNELKSDSSVLGLNIYASSGYRSYGDQKYIYDNYVRMDGMVKADTYSARAGYSEHQTGLAIDLNTVNMSFDGTSESNWLKDNCWKYGFIIRYPKDKENITGYMYEPWHIRYVGKELARVLYNNGNWLSLEEYYGIDSKYSD